MNRILSIAIDGPGGAGKSTMARALALRFGFTYVDTGAMYRVIGLRSAQAGADPTDAAAVTALLPDIHMDMRYDANGEQQMYLDGENVTGLLRTPEISARASAVSAIPAVRAFLLETQRELARRRSVVMDGRDIGTVVLPDAQLKIFLTASPEVRAARRCRELEEKGTPQPYAEVLREMNERDLRDTTRSAAPLRAAEDAVTLDTSELDRSQVEARLAAMVEGLLRS